MASNQRRDTGTSNTLNLVFSSSAEECDLHNDRLPREISLPQNSVAARLRNANYGSSSGLVFCSMDSCLPTAQCLQFIQIDSWAEALAPLQAVMPHTNFPKVTWMIFVKVESVVMHSSSISMASWVLVVLTDAAVAHVAPEFPGLP